MPKVLILPDTHNRWERNEQIVALIKPDLTIYLGDHFDDFGDGPNSIADTADWFHHSVNQKDRIHIAGNHDLHYWFKDNERVRCAGYDQFKSIVINDFVKKEDWEKMVFFYNLDNKWLLSHGGLHPYWINPSKFDPTKSIEFSIQKATRLLNNQVEPAKKALYQNGLHWFAIPGYGRCRRSPYYGGIFWCDWNKEFQPIKGLHQIVGHTPKFEQHWINMEEGEDKVIKTPPIGDVVNPTLSDKNSYNICIDTTPGSKYYVIYENGNLSIHEWNG